ncbi:hypothetical protein BCR32DRAFT_292980 [Anaeromyces robustus]|jgi:hypothetical protein|uniref:Uncharacterized protein n=1 Tax=Anaeromyces robustus TaxID=1754192 RepID=A0A1Y1X936_9FUNG|nr:hypothetical protein BCR32DRAFT_292980 [Anaeromyces robustus]|eukprot:ORX81936.1 hypothetical protein BCR32DRAFT_292980 [Anaeromyces robustus]
MKTISLYIFTLIVLVKSIASFSCEDVHLDSKETLYKATEKKVVENKIINSEGTEYDTWYIDPCRSVEKEPEDSKNGKCPKNSKVCLVKSFEFNGEKGKKIMDIKGYAVNNPPQDPVIKESDYILNFEGEEKSGYSTEFRFSCVGNNDGNPEVELDESKKKVVITWKGICVSDGKTSPVDDDKKNKDEKSGGGHFFLRFIFIIVVCYFVIGMCYNFFVLNKSGIDIIPHVDFWNALIGSILDKLSELFGRRGYRPILPDTL